MTEEALPPPRGGTFVERLDADQKRRAEWLDNALKQKEKNQVMPTFKPEISQKTARIIAQSARYGADALDVFARQERELRALEERRKRAADDQRAKESGLFMPQINSARSALTSDEQTNLAPWERMEAANDWARKRKEKIEAAMILRDEKRSGCRPYLSLEGGSQQSSTLGSPRRGRTIVHDLPLPSLPSEKHSGKIVLLTAELHRAALAHRDTLRQIGPSMRLESPRKFSHLKGNEHWLGYETPDPSDATFVSRENKLLMERLHKIVTREPEYATVQPIQPGGAKPSPRKSRPKHKA